MHREPAEPLAIRLTRYALIGTAILLGLFYALWCLGGRIADRRGQRRHPT